MYCTRPRERQEREGDIGEKETSVRNTRLRKRQGVRKTAVRKKNRLEIYTGLRKRLGREGDSGEKETSVRSTYTGLRKRQM